MRKMLAVALLAGTLAPLGASAQAPGETIARFDGGIGSQPFSRNAQNEVVDNDVLGVRPGGRPWVIERLRADVKADGRISVDGRALLLAGGGNVGRTGGLSVHARLFCAGIAHNSGTESLDANGDFRIEGVLQPLPPSPCADAILLIVSGVAPAGSWFAAGIPKD